MKRAGIVKKAENRKARFNYELVEDFTAGIVLTGCEIKSIRSGNVSIGESYCHVRDGEVFVKGMHVAVYDKSGDGNADPARDRKLLLKRSEIRKLKKAVAEDGMTVVPTTLFINEAGVAKLSISLAKGKHSYDKRQAIKERDLDRQTRKER
jgi:SsrA-binding protein